MEFAEPPMSFGEAPIAFGEPSMIPLKTTRIYTHVQNRSGRGAQSLLDLL
jgi:hypothetical protein